MGCKISAIITLFHPSQYLYNYIIPYHSVSLLLHYNIPLCIPIITLCHPIRYPYNYIMPPHLVSLSLNYAIQHSPYGHIIPSHSVSILLYYATTHNIIIITLFHSTQYPNYYITLSHIVSLLLHPTQYPYYYITPSHIHVVSLLLHYSIPISIAIIKNFTIQIQNCLLPE